MSNRNVQQFEAELLKAIKGAFERYVQENEPFHISASQHVADEIDEMVKHLDVTVQGFTANKNEFSVNFDLGASYKQGSYQESPQSAKVYIDNNGDFEFDLYEKDMKYDWELSVTDEFFNGRLLSEEQLDKAMIHASQQLLLNILKA
ncbi:MAG: hypothetical protein EBU08_04585 [Micrococcales bacterium]|nr:hypothetical protein [Micrococcales bacterium]